VVKKEKLGRETGYGIRHGASLPRDGKAAQRREKIIEAARKLFIDNGFHATGVAQIAKESGIAVGQLYRDFASKEEIIAAIAAQDTNEVLNSDDIERSVADRDESALWRWLEEFFKPDPECPSVLIADIVVEASRNPKVAGIFGGCHDRVRARLLGVLEVLVPGDAMVAARDTMADMTLMVSLGILQHDLIRGRDEAYHLAGVAFASLRAQILALRNQHVGDGHERVEKGGLCSVCSGALADG
jgi:AcrR family transcriptional regulator